MTVALARVVEDQQSLREIAVQLFNDLAQATSDGVGITRECFAEGENYAIELFRATAEAHGLHTSFDSVANLIISLPGDDGSRPALYLGSHADSVPQGGNFDGAAGVIAALLCLIRLRREGLHLPTPVRGICLRAEESAFYGRANIGSRTLFGLLSAEDLDAKCRGKGRTLWAAMESAGITLVKGDLRGLVRARRLSEATMRNIKQNLFFAFVYNALGVPLAAGVLHPFIGLLLSPIVSAAAMSASSVSVIGNALRLRAVRL